MTSNPNPPTRTLAESTPDERITPPEQQVNPSLAAAVESAPGTGKDDPANDPKSPSTLGINRSIDTIAARDDVPAHREAGVEVTAAEADTKQAAVEQDKEASTPSEQSPSS